MISPLRKNLVLSRSCGIAFPPAPHGVLRPTRLTPAVWRWLGTVGYKRVDNDEGHHRGMAVRPGFQGSVVAHQLLDTVGAELRRKRCSRIGLGTTRPRRRAISFHEKNGFKASGRVNDFYGMPLFEYIKELE